MMKDKQNTMDNNSQFTTHNSPLIKRGYKNTEIGVIPVEWEVEKLGNISFITKLAGFEYSKHFNSYKDGGEIIVIRGTNITNNELDLSDIKTIPKKVSNYLIRSKLNKGDLVFAYVGTIGPIYLVDKNNRYHLGPNTSKITLQKSIDKNYIFTYFNSWLIKSEIKDRTSIGAQPSLSMSKIRDFNIILPSLPEQTAIATVLSDTDKLLQALQKKIAKKQAIKKGAMQVLLKPKEGWVVKPLGKFVNFSNGKAHENHIDANGEFVVINSKFVSTGGRVFKRATANFSPLKKGDIVMVMSDIPNGKALAKCFLVPKDNKYALNQRICSIRTEEADTKFLLYILNRNKYYLAFDSGTGQTNLKKEDVLNCPIPLPPTKEEQTKIATILSDMNIEIEALEKQLAKYKQVKQGLMQVLLTGKIRLV